MARAAPSVVEAAVADAKGRKQIRAGGRGQTWELSFRTDEVI